MNTIRTGDLTSILSTHPHSSRYYLGTFAADTIPNKPTPFTCFVSNTDPQSEPGRHWVAFFVNQKGYTYYFDSYGLPPIKKNHLRFCQKSTQGYWTYNRQRLQNLTSLNCGFHCVRFIIETCRTQDPFTALSAMKSAPTNLTDKTAVTYMLMNERKWTQRPGVGTGTTTSTDTYTSRGTLPLIPSRLISQKQESGIRRSRRTWGRN